MSTEEKPKVAAVPARTESPYRLAVNGASNVFKTVYGEQAARVFAKEAGFALMACQNNVALQGCNPESIKQAVVSLALTGLTLNPVTSLCYLIPRKNVATLVVSYMGMIEILRNSGSVKNIRGSVVYDIDHFDFQYGSGEFLSHKPVLNRPAESKPMAAYAIATLPDGQEIFHVMDWNAVMKRKGVASSKAVWDSWEEEMAIKTVIRYLYKSLPKTEQATKAMELFDETVKPIEEKEVDYL